MLNAMTLLNVGDIIVGENAEPFFTHVAPVLSAGDMVVGQLEVPYTTRDAKSTEFERDPVFLQPLITSGLDLVTLAGNHLMDSGLNGFHDTIQWLKEQDLPYVGAGPNIEEARKPFIMEKNGTKIGYLNYNCVGPSTTWASSMKPGCAYIDVITHYELDHPTPGGPPTIYTWAKPESITAMKEDIERLRSKCDVLVVAFHKGLGHIPAKLADYEREVSHKAIEFGADLVIGHHAHILKGIEFYKGKPIFHGLCNFITYVKVTTLRAGKNPEQWAKRRKELFGFEPDPAYPTYPFHPDALMSIIAKCEIEDGKIQRVKCIPLLMNQQGHPVVLGADEQGQQVMDYLMKITEQENLVAHFSWDGDEILIQEKRC